MSKPLKREQPTSLWTHVPQFLRDHLSPEAIAEYGRREQAKKQQAWEMCQAHAQSWNARHWLGVDVPVPILTRVSQTGEPSDTTYAVPVPIWLRKTQPLKTEDLPVHLQDTRPMPSVSPAQDMKPLIMERIKTQPLNEHTVPPKHTRLKQKRGA